MAIAPAPTGVQVAVVSQTQLTVSWAAAAGATSYNVYRSTSPSVQVIAANKVASSTTTTSFQDSALTASTAYYYKVTAVNTAGESVGSAEVSGTTSSPAAAVVTISGFSPISGAVGSTVTLTGTNLTSVSQVLFTGPSPSTAFVQGAIATKAATSITATVPSTLAAGSYTVSVVFAGGEAAAPGAFTFSSSGGGGSGSPTASGTLTVTGATAVNAATSLTPRADGFEVKIDQNEVTSYRFASAPNGSASQVDVTVNVAFNGAISVAYFDAASRTSGFCTANCGVTVTPASGATHPVTVAFSNTPMGGNLRLNGSLVGDAQGADWVAADLPGATTSNLTLAGTAVRAVSGDDSTADLGGGISARAISVRLSDGSTLTLNNQTGSAGFTVSRVLPPATINFCTSACNVNVADTTGSTRVTFANTTLGTGGPVLNGTVDIARTSGSLTTNDAGSFTPVGSNIESTNDSRTLTFSVLGTAAQTGLSLLTVEVKGGRVVRAQAAVAIASGLFSCFDNGAAIGTPACDGVSVAADGRTVSFTNAVLRGGALGAAARNVTFNGTVVAKGP